jgi:hypothetical protein
MLIYKVVRYVYTCRENNSRTTTDSIRQIKSDALSKFKFADNRNKSFTPIQKKVSITMVGGGAQSEGIASNPADAESKLSDFTKIKAMFDENVTQIDSLPYQCAEPHAFANIIQNTLHL